MSTTPKAQATAIKAVLSSRLPALLTAAGLDNFTDYLVKPPNDGNKKQIGVYMARDINATDRRTRMFIIDVQIPGVLDFDQSYHSVIMPLIEQYVTAGTVGMVNRDSIEANLFPIEPGDGSTGILYIVTFSEELDDEDD